MKKFDAMIVSDQDHENVTFEILYENKGFAWIYKEPGKNFEIELYGKDGKKPWHFDLDEFLAILNEGRENLKTNP